MEWSWFDSLHLAEKYQIKKQRNLLVCNSYLFLASINRAMALDLHPQ